MKPARWIMICLTALSGCGTMFENRVLCTPNKTEAAFVSWYSGFGVGAIISPKDAGAICGGVVTAK